MYRSMNIQVSSGPVYDWCDITAHKANNLYNAALFRQRQLMCSRKKSVETLSENEREVLKEFDDMNRVLVSIGSKARSIPKSGVLSYTALDDLMKHTDNPDYYAFLLPRQTAQHVLKHVCRDLKSFFEAIKEYKAHPERFTGVPKLPHYKRKQGMCSYDVSNQDCVIRKNKKGHYAAKLPLTKATVSLGKADPGVLKEVHVTPMNGIYQISFVFDDGRPAVPLISEEPDRIAAIDFGIDNFMAVTNNCELPCLLYKGGVIKSANRLYNKKTAAVISKATKGTTDKFIPTEEYYSITRRRNNIVNDFMLQTGRHFITWCVENRIDTIVMGNDPFWKQEVNIGHVNNQKFVQIPYDRIKRILEYLAERHGIRVLKQEESYTSKSSFPDRDFIPVYGEDDGRASFSGKRVHRGLYCASHGIRINADINGSANILRKCQPDAFDGVSLRYDEIEVIRHPMYEAMIQNRNSQKNK